MTGVQRTPATQLGDGSFLSQYRGVGGIIKPQASRGSLLFGYPMLSTLYWGRSWVGGRG